MIAAASPRGQWVKNEYGDKTLLIFTTNWLQPQTTHREITYVGNKCNLASAYEPLTLESTEFT